MISAGGTISAGGMVTVGGMIALLEMTNVISIVKLTRSKFGELECD